MKSDRVTMKDVAKALGLSVSTVSKALKDSYEISTATKTRVLDFVAQHNFSPNPIAKSLKDGKSKSIGVIFSTVDNNFYSQVINGIESIAYQHGYNIIINQSHESFEREIQNIRHLTLRAIDGLLISVTTETDDFSYLKSLQEKGLPIVLIDRLTEEIDTHKVKADNVKATYTATKHLLNSGFKNIAHVTSSENVSITTERLEGYKMALAEFNIPLRTEYIKYCLHGGMINAEVDEALSQLLDLPLPPQAIFTASDRITTQSMCYLNQRNITIPHDIALIGFTNTTLAGVLNPPLSRIKQPAFEMGQVAVQKLIELIERRRPVYEYDTIIMDTVLEIRKSSQREP